jgi:four helix bundle protein
MSSKPFDIRERSYIFGRDVFAFTRRNLGSSDFVVRRLAVQLIDAAGSVGANLEEAADGQSKADFISKNCIALKEVREAKFWLRQLRDADPQRLNAPATPLISEAEELRKIVTSIVVSAKRNRSFRGERSK